MNSLVTYNLIIKLKNSAFLVFQLDRNESKRKEAYGGVGTYQKQEAGKADG